MVGQFPYAVDQLRQSDHRLSDLGEIGDGPGYRLSALECSFDVDPDLFGVPLGRLWNRHAVRLELMPVSLDTNWVSRTSIAELSGQAAKGHLDDAIVAPLQEWVGDAAG